MSFSYATTAPGARDTVRLLISDTASGTAIFSDEELDMFLAMWDSDVNLSAAQALRSIAADQARLAIRYSIQGFTMDRTTAAAALAAMADVLEKRALASPWEKESVLDHEIGEDGVDRSNYVDTDA